MKLFYFFLTSALLAVGACRADQVEADNFDFQIEKQVETTSGWTNLYTVLYRNREITRDSFTIRGHNNSELLSDIIDLYEKENGIEPDNRIFKNYDCQFIEWALDNPWIGDTLLSVYKYENTLNKCFELLKIKKENIQISEIIKLVKKALFYSNHVISNQEDKWLDIANNNGLNRTLGLFSIKNQDGEIENYQNYCQYILNKKILQDGVLSRHSQEVFYLMLGFDEDTKQWHDIYQVRIGEGKSGYIKLKIRWLNYYDYYPLINW